MKGYAQPEAHALTKLMLPMIALRHEYAPRLEIVPLTLSLNTGVTMTSLQQNGKSIYCICSPTVFQASVHGKCFTNPIDPVKETQGNITQPALF